MLVECVVLVLAVGNVLGVPYDRTPNIPRWRPLSCPEEQLSLYETCGGAFDKYMGNVEKRAMADLDLKDPTSCLYEANSFVDSVDFIVIGAGASGSVVAGRLSENIDWEVMVLEAGEAAPTASQIPSMYFNYRGDPLFDWSYSLLPQDNACLITRGICTYPRGKVIGGTATIHGMMYMRGNPADYDMLIDDGIVGWSWKDVLPYFLMSENNQNINEGYSTLYHNTRGPLNVARFNNKPPFSEDLLSAYKELGHEVLTDLNGPTQKGFAIAQATTKDGRRLTTAKAYMFPNNQIKSNLYILPKATVHKILIENGAAVGVVYERNGIKKTVRARKEVILSAGTIASPQLLMLSGIGPKRHLKSVGVNVVKDLPGVGQNLANHVSTELFYYIGTDTNDEVLSDESAEEFFQNRLGPLTSTGLSQVTGFMWSNYTIDARPDLQIFHAGFMGNCSKTGKVGEPIYNGGPRIFSISPTVLHARSRGWVKLRNQYATSYPLIYGGILTNTTDVKVLLEGIKRTNQILETTAMKNKKVYLNPVPVEQCKGYTMNTEDYWRCYISYKTNPENHQVGTCRMGAITNPMAVTDNELRVIGIKNLRVADASVFVRTPSGNLQAPAIMVGERAAAFLDAAWRK